MRAASGGMEGMCRGAAQTEMRRRAALPGTRNECEVWGLRERTVFFTGWRRWQSSRKFGVLHLHYEKLQLGKNALKKFSLLFSLWLPGTHKLSRS